MTAQEVFKDNDGRAYIISVGRPQPHHGRIYIDKMTDLRWIDENHVLLPYGNGAW